VTRCLTVRRSARHWLCCSSPGAGHNVLAKLMYAHTLPSAAGPPDQVQLGAQIMFYGGNAVELVLAVLGLSACYTRTGRGLRRDHERTPTDPATVGT